MIPALLAAAALVCAAPSRAEDSVDPTAVVGQARRWTQKARDIQAHDAAVRGGQAAPETAADG